MRACDVPQSTCAVPRPLVDLSVVNEPPVDQNKDDLGVHRDMLIRWRRCDWCFIVRQGGGVEK